MAKTKKINLNKASVEELANLRMIGKGRAEALVKYRNQHGPFRTCDDVKNVPGFSDKMIQDLKTSGIVCE